MFHGEGVAMPGLKGKSEPRQPHGRKLPSPRPHRQEHECREHRQSLSEEIVSEACAEQHGRNRREIVGGIGRVGHVGCFEHEPTEQREKCRGEARANEAQAASLYCTGFRSTYELQFLRGNELDE